MDLIDNIVRRIYQAYGTHSGCLFGLRPEQEAIVEAIVKATMDCIDDLEYAKMVTRKWETEEKR